jgi:hypothetical protein
MPSRIKLPLLTGFRVSGFEPIYSAAISLAMKDGPYIILGGNGLGKTTLIQAIVYGLAGPLDSTIEEVKALRWSSSYFRGRLQPNQVDEAQVEVDFRLGRNSISVRRGFRGSDILAVKDGRSGWMEDDAESKFGALVNEYGGYLSAKDFAFVVHRLLYLPESRRLIAWDTDAQIRLLMLLNQDIAREADFRDRRAQLKMLDSKKRHLRVAINKAEVQLASLLEYDETHLEELDDETVASTPTSEQESIPGLVQRLTDVARKRADADRNLRSAREDLSRVSEQLDSIRSEIEAAEAGLVRNFLAEAERAHNLALSKLIESAICPACGQQHADLAARARANVRNHTCALCGSEEAYVLNPALAQLRERLNERLREQQAFEDVIRLARAESEALQAREFELQSEVNERRFSRTVVAMVERNLPDVSTANLQELKEKLEEEEAYAEAQMIALRENLATEYETFGTKVDARMDKLRASYADFATDFLGLQCELEEVSQGGLLDLKLFVPKFDDVLRETPESCSEAQRFFLDIAFRMALIDAAGGDRGTATFICETPETALDITYVENVVEMFSSFAQRQHNMLLTANVQPLGIAEKLLIRSPKTERPARIVDLLQVGRLSTVQQEGSRQIKQVVDRIMTAPKVSRR